MTQVFQGSQRIELCLSHKQRYNKRDIKKDNKKTYGTVEVTGTEADDIVQHK
ncbi:hypothetical protein A2U01_0008148, partial [Trifolium medium]|nr:hypothetical protein [Trifolium medium]